MAMSERDRRILIIGGVAAAAIVLLFLLFNLVSGGGGAEAPPVTIVPGNNPPPTKETPTPSPSVVVSFGGRDPFAVPSVIASALASSSATPSGSSSASATPTPTTTLARQTSVTTQDGKQVALMDVFVRNGVDRAHVQVQGQTYAVREGQVFAGSFQLTSIVGTCATIDYGDTSYDLCSPVT
jgi:hypothetical protein